MGTGMGQAEQTQSVKQAAGILRSGGIVAIPTETVYGLGADATNAAAVRRIFQIKGRPATNPLIVHVADVAGARRCVAEWPEAANRLAERFWPGPLTIVLPKGPGIVDEVTAGGPTVGVRVPDHPLTLEVIRRFCGVGGGGVAAPSANRSNHVSPTIAQHVRDDLGNAVDLILDGGPCGVGIESTVLSLATPVPTVLRPGGVSIEQLREVLGEVQVRGGSDAGMAASPGRQSRHYAPRARAVVLERDERCLLPVDRPDVALMALDASVSEPRIGAHAAAMPDQPEAYARHFYRVLRALDSLPNIAEIHIELPPDVSEWAAVRDRIIRATTLPTPADLPR